MFYKRFYKPSSEVCDILPVASVLLQLSYLENEDKPFWSNLISLLLYKEILVFNKLNNLFCFLELLNW